MSTETQSITERDVTGEYAYTDIVYWGDDSRAGEILSRLGKMTITEIAELESRGLVVLWRYEDFVFMAKPI